MTIERVINHGIAYLRLTASLGLKKVGGRVVQRRKVVLSLGPMSRHDDGKPDYLRRLRESYRAGRPLIRELEPYVDGAAKGKVTVTFSAGDPTCLGKPRRMAATILDPVFNALGLDELFASVKFSSKIGYDLTGIVRLLTYGRLLDPASKSATMGQNDRYYRPLVSSTNDDNVYDALDVIQRNARQIVRRMNTCVTRGTGRSSKVVFYDVTNFFFETPRPDPDTTDADGNVIEKGLRKMGVSKENRRQPIVQLGLFLDDEGIPVSFGMFPGNTLDHHTLRPAMEKTVDSLGLKRFVLVADRGMYSGTNMCHVTDAGNGYIVAKSLRKSTKREIAWAVSPEGYDFSDEKFRCKSRIVNRTAALPDGKRRIFKEKVVAYWSKAFYERELHENASFLSFVEKLKANPGGFRITAAQSQSLRRFLRKDVLDRKTGNVLDGTKLAAMIDDEKLSEFNELFGYYQIVTSELDMPDREVIDKYHGLTQIEDQFREMKGTLEARPVFVNTPEHIHAHLLVCFIALTMMRLVQRRIAMAEPKSDAGGDLKWSYGMSGERLSKALREWQALRHPGDQYQMVNASGEDICRVLAALGVNLRPAIYTKGGVSALKAKVKVF